MTSSDAEAARLAVLPFAPLLWVYFWCVLSFAKRLTRSWPRSLRAPVVGLLYAAELLRILLAQGKLYSRMTGIWVLGHDVYFMSVLLSELAVGILLVVRLAFHERRRGGSGAPG